MNFFKNKNIAIALTLCAMVSLGAQTVQAAAPAADGAKLFNVTPKTPSVFKGVVEDFAVDEQGRTVWLTRKLGDDEKAALYHVAVDKKTTVSSPNNAEVANGSIITVEYTGKESKNILAKKVSVAAPIPTVTEVGTVMELIPAGQGSDGGFRLRPENAQAQNAQDPAMNDIIFRYGSETEMGIAAKDIKVGTKLAVTYNGILTRSLPPQGFASAIADFNAPATLEAAK